MNIPCGHGLGAGITLIAGFPLSENFLNFFYENIYSRYGHYIDFQGRQEDFGSLHITIFGITGTKRGDDEGRACRISSQDKNYWNLQRKLVPFNMNDLISRIIAVIDEIVTTSKSPRISSFTLTLEKATVDSKSNNVRLDFSPSTSTDKTIIARLLNIPQDLGWSAKTRTEELVLHCTIGRPKIPFCGFRLPNGRLFSDMIEDELSKAIASMNAPQITIDRLKIVHYRRSSMLGLNGYLVIPLEGNVLAANSTMYTFLHDRDIIRNILDID